MNATMTWPFTFLKAEPGFLTEVVSNSCVMILSLLTLTLLPSLGHVRKSNMAASRSHISSRFFVFYSMTVEMSSASNR